MHSASLDKTGWARVPSGFSRTSLKALPVGELDASVAGTRQLLEYPWCAALVAPIRARLQRFGLLTEGAAAVQCTLFRKTPACNWKVPYHQDLSIPVADRIEHPELRGWSVKEDGHYVQASEALLSRMLAVRLHIDDCRGDAGALRVVPGSHRFGRIEAARISMFDKAESEALCEADAGDLILMRPLLLHASSKAKHPNGRRVLHFLFAPPQPGYGLTWRAAI